MMELWTKVWNARWFNQAYIEVQLMVFSEFQVQAVQGRGIEVQTPSALD